MVSPTFTPGQRVRLRQSPNVTGIIERGNYEARDCFGDPIDAVDWSRTFGTGDTHRYRAARPYVFEPA